MIRGTTDVVIRVEQRLGQQRANVSTTKTVDNPPTVATADNQPGQSKLGQMLACDGGAATSDLRQGGHVPVFIAERPQHPHPGGISQEREGQNRSIDLRCGEPICVSLLDRSVLVLTLGLDHGQQSSQLTTYSQMRRCMRIGPSDQGERSGLDGRRDRPTGWTATDCFS